MSKLFFITYVVISTFNVFAADYALPGYPVDKDEEEREWLIECLEEHLSPKCDGVNWAHQQFASVLMEVDIADTDPPQPCSITTTTPTSLVQESFIYNSLSNNLNQQVICSSTTPSITPSTHNFIGYQWLVAPYNIQPAISMNMDLYHNANLPTWSAHNRLTVTNPYSLFLQQSNNPEACRAKIRTLKLPEAFSNMSALILAAKAEIGARFIENRYGYIEISNFADMLSFLYGSSVHSHSSVKNLFKSRMQPWFNSSKGKDGVTILSLKTGKKDAYENAFKRVNEFLRNEYIID